ncbi:FISUMP domain-containing protein [Fibrobacter sp.]|uniref:FISUMP domain-containing protein n=1 Tax=Fibrobacter sp. TaxID=35828 RepID=UPI003890A4A7
MFNAVGGIETTGKKLKSQVGWDINEYNGKSGDGDNEYGLSIFPSGYYSNHDVLDSTGYSSWFQHGLHSSLFWTATDYNMKYACKVSFGNTSLGATEGDSDKSDGYPVRCIRNAE